MSRFSLLEKLEKNNFSVKAKDTVGAYQKISIATCFPNRAA